MNKFRAKFMSVRNRKQFLAVFATLAILFTSIGPSTAATFISQSSSTDTAIGNVSFAPKSSRLSAKSKAHLDKVVAANPSVSKFKVVGYSQWAPWATDKSYQKISLARANSVKAYLQQKGISVEIVTESGGLPKENNKSYKSRRAEIYSVTQAEASPVVSPSPTPTDAATPTPTTSPSPSNSVVPSNCQPLATELSSGNWALSDQCGAITIRWFDVNGGKFELSAANATSLTIANNQISSITVPSGISFKGDANTFVEFQASITGNVELLETAGTASSDYLDALGVLQDVTSGNITFNSNFAFTEAINDLCYALIGGTNSGWKQSGVIGYTGNLVFNNDVSITPSNATDESNCIDKLLATTTGRVTTKGLQSNSFRNFYEYDKIDLTGKINIIVSISNDPLVATTIKYSNPGDSDSTPDFTTSLFGVTGIDRVGNVFTLNPQ